MLEMHGWMPETYGGRPRISYTEADTKWRVPRTHKIQGLGQGAVQGNEGQVLCLRPVLGVDSEHLRSNVLMLDNIEIRLTCQAASPARSGKRHLETFSNCYGSLPEHLWNKHPSEPGGMR